MRSFITASAAGGKPGGKRVNCGRNVAVGKWLKPRRGLSAQRLSATIAPEIGSGDRIRSRTRRECEVEADKKRIKGVRNRFAPGTCSAVQLKSKFPNQAPSECFFGRPRGRMVDSNPRLRIARSLHDSPP